MEVLLKRWITRDGERALVSECEARGVPGSEGTTCLICETDSTMRRIWSYPAEWHRLDDAKIFSLFEQPFVPAAPAPSAAPSRSARPPRLDDGQGAASMQAVA